MAGESGAGESRAGENRAGAEENESKHRLVDEAALIAALAAAGFAPAGSGQHTDEYYDSPDHSLRAGDLVCRLRVHADRVEAAFKGPRRRHGDGSHGRVEIELPVAAVDEVRAALARQGLVLTWVLEKRRRVFRHPARAVDVCLDELPGLGAFVEVEGPRVEITEVRRLLGGAIGAAEPRNYHELATAVRPGTDRLTFG
jgi:predicted adenylyl cyclase CyaB